MKSLIDRRRRNEQGYALLLVLVMGGISLMALSGALSWTSTTANLTSRNNEYYRTVAAAEAATENIIARRSRDFQHYGEAAVYTQLDRYRTEIPSGNQSAYWEDFSFSNGEGDPNTTTVERLVSWGYTNLNSQYKGLRGMASTYHVVASAQNSAVNPPMSAAVRQEFQLACIPIFQFAIFYSIDLEINPGPNMNITGRVHSNANLYSQPVNTLTYLDHVTAAGNIILDKSPLDPSSRSVGKVRFQAEHDSQVRALTLPIGTNNSPEAVRAILEIPPPGEHVNSPMGRQRYFNKADLVLVVSNSTIVARSGSFNSFATVIPSADYDKFVDTVSFYNKREAKTVEAVQIDVGKLKTWSETNALLRPLLGNRDLSSVYVADKRTHSSSKQSGVRLVNGQTLPSQGLTVASPNPMYIQGHYNAPAAHLGTANTTLTKPASVVGDSITILSTAWKDANSTKGLSSRSAANTTVNAAFIGGIVPSDGTYYSGGVENFPRFLETWSGRMFTYNGSMVVLFYSHIAKVPWGGNDVYVPPNRNWAFDLNFLDATKLPPGTPMLMTTIRGSWAMVRPESVTASE